MGIKDISGITPEFLSITGAKTIKFDIKDNLFKVESSVLICIHFFLKGNTEYFCAFL